MSPHSIWEKLNELLTSHYISAFFLLLTVATILSLLVVLWWLKRRWRRLLDAEFQEESELDLLPSPSLQDQEALALISRLRKEIWELPESELQLNFEALNQRAVQIIRTMAAVYHPDIEVPQYEASLYELLQLIRRVTSRLTRLASGRPFSFFGNRRLSEYQRFYQVYRKINESPVLQVLRRHPYLHRAARWALNLKNLGNPLYWAGKEISREGYFLMLRWFYLIYVTQVARESMRLYSGRHFLTEKDRDATLVCYRLFSLTNQWGGPSAGEWSFLVEFVTGLPALETEMKLQILSRWGQGALPNDLNEQRLQTKYGLKLYREGLKGLLKGDLKPPPVKRKLIDEEMSVVK